MAREASRRAGCLKDARELLAHLLRGRGNERVEELGGPGAVAELIDDSRACARRRPGARRSGGVACGRLPSARSAPSPRSGCASPQCGELRPADRHPEGQRAEPLSPAGQRGTGRNGTDARRDPGRGSRRARNGAC